MTQLVLNIFGLFFVFFLFKSEETSSTLLPARHQKWAGAAVVNCSLSLPQVYINVWTATHTEPRDEGSVVKLEQNTEIAAHVETPRRRTKTAYEASSNLS